jgi:hypothetical protein
MEKYAAIKIPPGILRNGTKYQTKGRWYDGHLVRFFQGTIQPVGGWAARSTTGATITGVPNAALAWSLNTGERFLAIGTTLGLFVVNASNVVYDITPPAPPYATPYKWHLTNFGSYLIATLENPASSTYEDTANAYYWDANTANDASAIFTPGPLFPHPAPTGIYNAFTTGERFLVFLRGKFNEGSDLNDHPIGID